MNCSLSCVQFSSCTFEPVDAKNADAQQQQPDIHLCATMTSNMSENGENEVLSKSISISSFYNEAQYTAIEAQHRHILSQEVDAFSQQVAAATLRLPPVFARPPAAPNTMAQDANQDSVHKNRAMYHFINPHETEEVACKADPIVVSLKEMHEASESCYLYVFGHGGR
ncbi:hypothetical protein STCU_09973 [Strigomonas culicis]|uniref:Uncharacterized protein n=1 Tax=Strigomonas culicis TaxID=28005 RepID=S9V6A3_9TRYP|nr:hypothetical protein STCU_09973 [Strigomonas culicis]|eukprot:EPY18445.1 hypothetical protein STCU_09973 [Strigomonas culicis]